MANKNIHPYYDDSKEQFIKKYKEVLFNPGRSVQARELTQTQNLINEQLASNFETIYKNGSIIEGCGINVDLDNKMAYITSGKFYFDGRVHDVESQSLSITGIGEETLGLKIVEEFITSEDDSALFDPANGYPNYGKSGADRLKQEFIFVKDDSDMISLFPLKDGILQTHIKKPDYAEIIDMLAKRTYDESGNYLVDGMELYIEDHPVDTNKLIVSVEAGTAYVNGYEIVSPIPIKVAINKAQQSRSRLNEPKTYTSETLTYTLNERYVKSITHLTAKVETTLANVTKGAPGTIDSLSPYTSIDSLPASLNIGGIDYFLNTDYVLSNDGVDWSPNGIEPSQGTSYSVTFVYLKDMVEGSDFTLVEIDDNKTNIEFTGTGDLPVDSTQMLVDYEFYLARIDKISINNKGKVIVKTGSDTHYTNEIVPDESSNVLQLGWIKLFPNDTAENAFVHEYKYKRTTMRELYDLVNRVSDIEDNQAEIALETQAKEGELPTNLKGIFVDNLNNFFKSDVNHTEYSCALNIIEGSLAKSLDKSIISFNPENDILTNSIRQENELEHYTSLSILNENVSLENLTKTGLKNLNPYGILNGMGSASIEPARDFWINNVVRNIVRRNVITNRIDTTNDNLMWFFNRVPLASRNNFAITNVSSVSSSSRSSSETRFAGEQLETFARNITIQVDGKGWRPLEDVQVMFNNQEISATPTNTTVAGTKAGSLKVNTDGTFTGTIQVPSGTRTGTHSITFKYVDGEYDFNATFISEGVRRIFNRITTITTTRTVFTRRVIRRGWIDPLAQSFVFSEDKTFTGIDLFFTTKSDTEPFFVQIGYLNNGYPSSDSIFHFQYVYPDDVQTSANGSVATKIDFGKRIFIPENTPFFISIGSESAEYNIFISELGKRDLFTNKLVTKNSYLNGVLFSSSNNDTWSAHQTQDLTFRLYEGDFSNSGVIETENLTGLDFSLFMLSSEDIVPKDCNIKYQYSIDNGSTYYDFNPDEAINTGKSTQLKLKYILSGDGTNTPLLNTTNRDVEISKFNIDSPSNYITKTVTNVPAYNNVKLSLDVHIPTGEVSWKPYISYDNRMWIPIDNTVPDDSITIDEYYTANSYSIDMTQYQEVALSGITGTFEKGETITGGTSAQTAVVVDIDELNSKMIIGTISGTFTDGETITGGISSATAIANSFTVIDNKTSFKGKIEMNSTNHSLSPTFMGIKWIMK
jgi:hypothetical protein